MATKIVTKNSSTAGAAPTATDLVQGELAVNVADKRLYTEDNAGAIVELGTNPSTIDINAGTIDGATVGASSASTGAFTTLTATGAFTSRGIDDNADATAITIDSSENVGIGTSSPSEKLHVNGGSVQVESTGNTAIRLKGGVGTLSRIITSDGSDAGYIDYDHSADSWIHRTAGTERMRIDSSGNVIVGGTTAQAADAVTLLPDGEVTAAGFYFSNNIGSAMNNTGIRKATTNTMVFDTNSTERMRIDSSGNVGIGTSPSTKLHVQDSAGSPQIRIDNQGTASGIASLLFRSGGAGNPSSIIQSGGTSSGNQGIVFKHGDFGAEAERMRIDASGNLLVGGTTTPSSNNQGAGFINTGASGLVQWQSGTTTTSGVSVARFYNPNGNVGSIQLSGTATSYVTSSDQRLKENIADADDAGSKIDSIQVRKYDWKADGSHQDYGMIAQELQTVAPEAVSGDADSEEMMGVDYSKLVPMLIKEIQSLRNRVAQLETGE